MGLKISAAFCFTIGILWLGYGATRPDSNALIGVFAIVWALYAWLIFRQKDHLIANWRWWLGLGIVLRVALLWNWPNLSDDIFRFLWDGHLWANGIHPFLYTPRYLVENQWVLPDIMQDLYPRLNSQNYYTVYPPVCQGVFWIAAKVASDSITGGIVVIKLFLLICELSVLWALLRLLPDSKGRYAMLCYALNPLAIVEIIGNCHFEGAMVAGLLLALVALQRQQINRAAAFWALSVASKLLPVLFVPLVWAWLGWRRGLYFVLIFSVLCIVLFAPLLSVAVLRNMAASVHLYFQQFEFNASLYYIAKFGGNLFAEWDTGRRVAPVLAALTVAVVGWQSWRLWQKEPDIRVLIRALLVCSMVYLLNATTVHPWYILVPLALGCLTNSAVAIVWTGVAVCSYSHYYGGGLKENFWWIGLEYALLLLALCYQHLYSKQRRLTH